MRKKIVFVILLLLLCSGCTESDSSTNVRSTPLPTLTNNLDNSVVLVVDGQTIRGEQIIIYQSWSTSPESAIVPFTVVLEAMGFPVNWINQEEAEVTIRGEDYVLSIKERTLCKKEGGWDEITTMPGCVGYYIRGKKELYIDINSIEATLFGFGIRCKVNANSHTRRVEIKKTLTLPLPSDTN